jgi:hypothetical protein
MEMAGMVAVKKYKALIPIVGGKIAKLTVCHSLLLN